MKKYILGIKIDDLNKNDVLELSNEFLLSNKSHKIFTPNPEMIVKAKKDRKFFEVLNSSDINLCDGAGLAFFAKCKRYSGVDFMIDLCALAEQKGMSVFLLGSGADHVVLMCAKNLKNKYPKLNIVGFEKGNFIDEQKIETEEGSGVLQKIANAKPDILFVAFGMGKQEKWIDYNLNKLPSVKIAVGVGGSFDFISGCVKRAPCSMRKIGLEWLYRLIKQPKRFLRIFNAVVVFSFLVIKEKLKL